MKFDYNLIKEDNLVIPRINFNFLFNFKENISNKRRMLWLEDDNNLLNNVLNRLKRWQFNVYSAKTLDEFNQKYTSNNFDIVLVDLLLKGKNQNGSGIDAINSVREKNKKIPIFVLSAFLDDSFWINQLNKLITNGRIEKPLPVISNESNQIKLLLHDSIGLYQKGLRWAKLKKAVDYISFSEINKMNDKDIIMYKKEVWEKNKKWLLKKFFEEDIQWVMILEDEIIESSTPKNKISQRRIAEFSKKTDKFPLVFIRPPIIEECDWSNISRRKSKIIDYYPTIQISVGSKKSHLKKITSDFDTGADKTHISDEIINSCSPFDPISEGFHFGNYIFSEKKLVVALTDENGITKYKNVDIAIVHEWINSGFVKINPDRKALVGRDILAIFPLELKLLSKSKKTIIHFEK